MARSTQDPRMAFSCEQDDQFASLKRQYVLLYYYEDQSIEMRECKGGKLYLRRSPAGIPPTSFFLGATVNVLGKPTTIVGYADEVTRQLCEEHNETTTVIAGETAFPTLGRYLSILTEECGFSVSGVQMAWVKQEMVPKYDLPEELAGTRAVIIRAVRADAIEKGFDFIRRCPGTCTAQDTVQAKAWGALCTDAAAKPLAVFGEANSSVVVIKPHLILSHQAGSAIQQLLDLGLEPTGFSQMSVGSSMADAFLTPYRGVLPALEATTKSFEGTAWVLQLVSIDDSMDVVSAVRDVCGPYDTTIAKKLFPKTIRARFGLDQASNAVHCCDLPGEGPLYADFFFKR